MFGRYLVAIYFFPAEIAVDLVQVQPMVSGMREAAFRISARNSSMLRARPG